MAVDGREGGRGGDVPVLGQFPQSVQKSSPTLGEYVPQGMPGTAEYQVLYGLCFFSL